MGITERREREREEVRTQILDAARELFDDRRLREGHDAAHRRCDRVLPHHDLQPFRGQGRPRHALCEEDFARLLADLPRGSSLPTTRWSGSGGSAAPTRASASSYPNHYRFMFMTRAQDGEGPRAELAGRAVLRGAAARRSRRAIEAGQFRTATSTRWPRCSGRSLHGVVALLITMPPRALAAWLRPRPISWTRSIENGIRGFLAPPRKSGGADGLPGPEEPPARPAALRDHRVRGGLRGDAGARAGRALHGPPGQGHGHDRERERRHLGHLARRPRTSTSPTPSRRRTSCACGGCPGWRAPTT